MAQHVEPMDVDSEFDNKENSSRHSNVPCTEKGYEELDVSELNMKLRYSVTPHASPMSKSYTAHVDNRIRDADDSLNHTYENASLTRSLNSAMAHDCVIKQLKSLPLQTISTDQTLDNRSSFLRQLDSTVTDVDNNVTLTINGSINIDENLSLPSSSSSAAHTPEATTPTNITRNEERSPIIRGLKSVFNMFRTSQSPIPPLENHDILKHEIDQLDETYCEDQKTHNLASTPMSAHRNKESSSSKRNSPLKDSIIFKDDLETEIQWKEDTILFSDEKIPIHKLLLPNTKLTTVGSATPQTELKLKTNLDTTVESMDISFNNSLALDNTITPHVDSDGEFVDCETTFTKTGNQNYEANAVVSETIKELVTELEPNKNATKNSENITSEALKQVECLDTENNNTANENAETKEIKPEMNVVNDVDNVLTVSETVTKPEATTQVTNAAETEVELSTDTFNINNTAVANVTENNLSSDFFNINNTAVGNVTENNMSIDICDMPEALATVADSTPVNVVTFDSIKTDINIGSEEISNEDLSQTTVEEGHTEGDFAANVGDGIDKIIMVLEQTVDVKNGDITDSHFDKTIKEDIKTESQEKASESNLANLYSSHAKEPENIPLPNDHDESLKTEDTNNEQHGINLPSEKNDILDDTNDIVKSLTEIIGESLNNTESIIPNQSHIIKQIQGSQCPNEKDALPDLINETIKSTDFIESVETGRASTLTPLITEADNVEEVFGEQKTPEQKSIPHGKENDITTAVLKGIDETPIDEEIILSGNNSPFVSVTAELELETSKDNIHEIDLPIISKNVPSSPPIKSKGYNFNFDEMDNPFAIATKIKSRMSPPPTTYNINDCNTVHKNDNIAIKAVPNRRRSQPSERKRCTMNRKKVNTTFDVGSLYDQYSKGDSKHFIQDLIDKNVTENREISKVLDFTQDKTIDEHLDASPKIQVEENQPLADINTVKVISETKSEPESIIKPIKEDNTCSSENSNYYSAGSSSDLSISKNVFNLPEIDDKNFNPFATKSKMRQSPPINLNTPFTTQSKLNSPNSTMVVLPKENTFLPAQDVKEQEHKDKMDIELMEKEASSEISNTSSLSKSADTKEITTREINTEDEDTEEGPFLEAEDAINNILEKEDDNMMQFNEIPTQTSKDNPDGGELFIDAEAFEFLLNQNQCNVVADSGKESLFLKFDPLFAKRMSRGGEIFAALNQVQKRQSTPTKPTRPSLRNEASPIAGPSNLNTTYDAETNDIYDNTQDSTDLNITVAKPMMVVTPAVNAAVTPKVKTTPPRSNRRSINFTSPAMAVIDRLLSLSGNNSHMGHDTTVTTQTNREHAEADSALSQLRELLAEKEISVYQLRSESKELKDRLSTMETQVKILEADGQDRLNKINELNDRLVEKAKINKSMAAVVEEYERTIASLIAETEQDKKRHAEERTRLISERDEQTAHLASMEVSFSDLHSKYEKSKQMILSYKANEEICKKSIRDFEENLAKMQLNYEALKQHATSKLNHANKEFQRIAKAHEAEVLKHNALIKRKDMHITSLEETLAQKTKANEELTAICDELINKVG